MDMFAPDDNDLASQGDCRKPAVQWRRGLFIPQGFFETFFRDIIEMKGLIAAYEEYEHMCIIYSTLKGWPKISSSIKDLLKYERKKQEARKDALQKMESQPRNQFNIYPQAGSSANIGSEMKEPKFGLLPADFNNTPMRENKNVQEIKGNKTWKKKRRRE